jgi:hypothetical protein
MAIAVLLAKSEKVTDGEAIKRGTGARSTFSDPAQAL